MTEDCVLTALPPSCADTLHHNKASTSPYCLSNNSSNNNNNNGKQPSNLTQHYMLSGPMPATASISNLHHQGFAYSGHHINGPSHCSNHQAVPPNYPVPPVHHPVVPAHGSLGQDPRLAQFAPPPPPPYYIVANPSPHPGGTGAPMNHANACVSSPNRRVSLDGSNKPHQRNAPPPAPPLPLDYHHHQQIQSAYVNNYVTESNVRKSGSCSSSATSTATVGDCSSYDAETAKQSGSLAGSETTTTSSNGSSNSSSNNNNFYRRLPLRQMVNIHVPPYQRPPLPNPGSGSCPAPGEYHPHSYVASDPGGVMPPDHNSYYQQQHIHRGSLTLANSPSAPHLLMQQRSTTGTHHHSSGNVGENTIISNCKNNNNNVLKNGQQQQVVVEYASPPPVLQKHCISSGTGCDKVLSSLTSSADETLSIASNQHRFGESHPASDSGYGGDRASDNALENNSGRGSSEYSHQSSYSSNGQADTESVSSSTLNTSGSSSGAGSFCCSQSHNRNGVVNRPSAAGSSSNTSSVVPLASVMLVTSPPMNPGTCLPLVPFPEGCHTPVDAAVPPQLSSYNNGSNSDPAAAGTGMYSHGPVVYTTVECQANLLRYTPSPFRETTTNCSSSASAGKSMEHLVQIGAGQNVSSQSCAASGDAQQQQVTSSTASPATSASSGSLTPSGSQHVVYVHVNPGETLSVRVDNDLQHIPGPATVRMVSQSSGMPGPLPLHVPPGHVVQQILDEHGTLRHLILSPEQPQAPGSMVSNPYMNLPTGPMGPSVSFTAPTATVMPSASAVTPVPPPGPLSTNFPPVGGAPLPGAASVPIGMSAYPNISSQRAQQFAAGAPMPPPRQPMPGIHAHSLHNCEEVVYNSRQTTAQLHRKAPLLNRGSMGSGKYYPSEDNAHDSAEYPEGSNDATDGEEQAKLIELLSKLQAPQVTEIGSHGALVQWQRIDCSDASCGPFPEIEASDFIYEVLVAERRSPEGKYKLHFRGSETEHHLQDLKPATEYLVKLRAIIEPYTGNLTEPAEFATKPDRPDRPQLPKLDKRTKNSVTLKWTAPRNNGASISAYHLDCDFGSGNFEETYSGPERQFILRKLSPGTTYRVRLAASNEVGKSDFSDTLQVCTSGTAPLAPAPPQLLEAEPYAMHLAWQKRTGDEDFILQMEDPLTGYGFIPMCNGRELGWICSELRHNQDYRFRLAAANEDGTSPWSEIVTYKTRPARPGMPGKPYNKGRIHASNVKIAWEAPSDNGGSKIHTYLLESTMLSDAGHESGWAVVYAGPECEHNVTGLSPGRTYLFRVSCSSDGGRSSYSEAQSVTMLPVAPGLCRMPSLMSKPKGNSVHLKWVAPDQTGGAEITHYEVKMQHDGQSQMLTPGLRSDCVFSYLLPGRNYLFSVRAHNKAGAGPWSESLAVTTMPGPPETCTNLKCIPKGPCSILVSWSEPVCNGAPVLDYRVLQAVSKCFDVAGTAEADVDGQDTADSAALSAAKMVASSSPQHRSGSVSGASSNSGVANCDETGSTTPDSCASRFAEFNQIYAGSAPQFESRGLTPATDYAFKVQAVNCAGSSKFSQIVCCQTPPGPPAAVQGVLAEAVSTTEVSLSWNVPLSYGSNVTGYHVDIAPCPSSIKLPLELAADLTQCLVCGLDAATNYKFRVLATSSVGNGAWSGYVKATTYSPPPLPPVLECAGAAHNTLRLKWADIGNHPGEPLSYSLEMENKNGSYSPVYEGSAKLHKVPRLQEATVYRFRIRATSPTGGAGSWSEPIEFETSRAPPASLKGPPRIAEVPASSNTFQIDWPVLKMSLPVGDKLAYCLQMCSSNSNRSNAEDFKMLYQGCQNSYTLENQLQPNVTYKFRVCAVRISLENIEVSGPPGPVATFSVSAPKEIKQEKPEKPVDVVDDDLTAKRSLFPSPMAVMRGQAELSERQCAFLAVLAFSLVALVLAFLVQWLIGGD